MRLIRVFLFLLPFVFVSIASGQSTESSAAKDAAKQTEAQRARTKKALAMLDGIIVEAGTMKLPENRLKILALSADILWTRDEKRARAILKVVTDDLFQVIKALDPTEQDYWTVVQCPMQLRSEILMILMRRDPLAALEFLRATRLPPPPIQDPRNRTANWDLQLELNIANLIVGANPEGAIRIGEESLAKGLTHGIISLVSQLYPKNPQAAIKLVSLIMKRLESEDLLGNEDAANVAISLLTTARESQTRLRGDGQSSQSSPDHEPLMTEATYEALQQLILKAALRAPIDVNPYYSMPRDIGRNLLMNLQGLSRSSDFLRPEIKSAIERRMGELMKTLDPYSRLRVEYADLFQSGSPEAIAEIIPKVPREMRAEVTRQAAMKAYSNGHADQAREIIADNIESSAERNRLLEDLERQIVWQASSNSKIEESRQAIARISNADERLGMMIQLATNLISKRDTKSARTLLDEVRFLADGKIDSYPHLQGQIQIAQCYASVDIPAALEILQPVIAKLNELISAFEVINGFDSTNFRDGEFLANQSSLGNSVQQIMAAISVLAHSNFDVARTLAASFQRREIRVLADLAVVQGLLSEGDQPNARPGMEGRTFPSTIFVRSAR